MSGDGKFSDIVRGPRQADTGPWDKPLVIDDRSLPSKEDSARFNVAVADGVEEELRAKAAAKAAKTRSAYGGAPSLDDTTPPWVDRGEEAPEEWSPSRSRGKQLLLGTAAVVCSIGFAVAYIQLPSSGDTPISTPDNPLASLQEQAADGSPTAPPPLMANPVSDGTMKFQVLAINTDIAPVELDSGVTASSGGFLVVDMKVINAATTESEFDPLVQSIITDTGRQYGPRLEAQQKISGADMITRLNPGQEAEVRMAFDIPQGEVPVMLFLRENADSYGTTVKFN